MYILLNKIHNIAILYTLSYLVMKYGHLRLKDCVVMHESVFFVQDNGYYKGVPIRCDFIVCATSHGKSAGDGAGVP